MELNDEQKTLLTKALPDKAVTKHPTKTYLSTIKAIYVTERLNEVFGVGEWRTKVQHIATADKGMVIVKLILTIPKYGIYYESFGGNDNGGEGSKGFDLGDAFKGATTDALTKIGSYLGIGIEVFKGNGNTSSQPNNTTPKTPQTLPQPVKILPADKQKQLDALITLFHLKKEYLTPIEIQGIQRRIDKQMFEKFENVTNFLKSK